MPNQKKAETKTQQTNHYLKSFAEYAETFSGQDKWQTDQAAHQQHAADRTQPKYSDVNKARNCGRDCCQHQDHQRGAAGHTVHHAHKKRPRTEAHQMAVMMRLLFAGTVHVNVYMTSAVMLVAGKMHFSEPGRV